MIRFPNAKINIGLYITEKREDGFHSINSCFVPIPLQDAVEILPSTETVFESYGIPIPGESSDNLCLKAVNLLAQDFDIPPVKVLLQKNIPIGAGLGGGSADGTEVLKAIRDEFELKISNLTLESYALKLGSDCPFFVQNKVSIAKGRGEELKAISLNLAGWYIVIVNPKIHISTKQAYAGVKPKTMTFDLEQKLLETKVEQWKGQIENQFEEHILALYPEIKALKEKLYKLGASYASMTGSGATVYGLFSEKIVLENLDFPNEYFTWTCNL